MAEPGRPPAVLQHVINAGLLVSVVLLAGFTPVAAKAAMATLPPLSTGFFRFAIAGLLLLGTYRLLPKRTARDRQPIERRDYPRLLLAAFLCVPANQFFFLTGVKLANASHAGLFYALLPVLTFLITLATGSTRWSVRMGIAALLAFLGAASLFTDGLTAAYGATFLKGDVLLFFAVFSWAGYSIASIGLAKKYGAIRAAALVMTVGAALDCWAPLVDLYQLRLDDVTWFSIGGLVYITLGTSFLNYMLWFMALNRMEINRLSIVTNLAPVVAVVAAWWLLGEPLTRWLLVGAGLILAAITLANWPGVRTYLRERRAAAVARAVDRSA
jgi:drug/metabolite transporter (DMT)-like permease